jgi:hypothetical protein
MDGGAQYFNANEVGITGVYNTSKNTPQAANTPTGYGVVPGNQ